MIHITREPAAETLHTPELFLAGAESSINHFRSAAVQLLPSSGRVHMPVCLELPGGWLGEHVCRCRSPEVVSGGLL